MPTNKPPLYLTPKDFENGEFSVEDLAAGRVHLCSDQEKAHALTRDGEATPEVAALLRGVLERHGENALRSLIQDLESSNGRIALPPEFIHLRSS